MPKDPEDQECGGVSPWENRKFENTQALVMRQKHFCAAVMEVCEMTIDAAKEACLTKNSFQVGVVVECKKGNHRCHTVARSVEEIMNDVQLADGTPIFKVCHFAASEHYGRGGSLQLSYNAVKWRTEPWPAKMVSVADRAVTGMVTKHANKMVMHLKIFNGFITMHLQASMLCCKHLLMDGCKCKTRCLQRWASSRTL